MALTRVRRTELDIEKKEPSPSFEGIGAFGWASLLAIAVVAYLLVTNY